ncbi:MAG: complex I NDUFA9 subunit family protein [Burkholderiaceae bacterium]
MPHSRILVVGGTGFIGTHVVSRLSAQGRRVVVPTRRRERARHLIVLPTVEVVETDAADPRALAAVAAGCDAAVNLVGVLHGRPGSGTDRWGPQFGRAHLDIPAAIIEVCRMLGIRRYVHMSALGVTDGGKNTLPSRYLRSKAAGEEKVRQARDLDWTILRPSVVFGADDRFLNLFAALQRLLPVVALAKAEARFQPIWVGDVAQAIVNLVDARGTGGKTYALAGPEVFTLRQLVKLAGTWSGHPRPIVSLPSGPGRLTAWCLERLPGEPLMTPDNLDSMAIDNVSARPIDPDLGIVPASLSSLGPTLYGADAAARYDVWRTHARR